MILNIYNINDYNNKIKRRLTKSYIEYELDRMEKMVMSVWDIGCRNEHCKIVHKIIEMLVKEVECYQLSEQSELELGFMIVQKSADLLQMLEQQINCMLKYNELVKSESHYIYTPLYQIYTHNNLLLSTCFILMAITQNHSPVPLPFIPSFSYSKSSSNKNPILTSFLNQLTLNL